MTARALSLAILSIACSAQVASPQPMPPKTSRPAELAMTAERPPSPLEELDVKPDSSGPCVDYRSLWNFQDPATSEQLFQQHADRFLAERNRTCWAEALTQVARAQGLQRRFDEALASLDEARTALTEASREGATWLPSQQRLGIYLVLERGRVLNSSQRREQALPLFLEAWQLARSTQHDALAVDAAHMIAIACRDDTDEALMWNGRALALAEQSQDEQARSWLGTLYNNIGWTRFDRGEYQTALALFEQDERFRRARGQRQAELIARWSQARTLRALGRCDEALERQRALLAIRRQEALDEDGFVFEEIAECLHERRSPEAREYFEHAYRLLSQDTWFVNNEAERLARLRTLASKLGETPP